ncbi:MAG: anti-sigma factor antagonist [Calditrichaeota bacterium]|nr:MAG: anti-sigma factor antagonist [Calditrichota bacterium]
MNYREEKIGDVLVLRMQIARFDSTVSPEFKTEILRLVENEGAQKILVDLQQVQYVDSSGLGALLFGHRQAKSNAGMLKLVHLNPKVQTLMKIAKLEETLQGFDDEAAALASFAE